MAVRMELEPTDPACASARSCPNAPWILTRDSQQRLILRRREGPRTRPLCLSFDAEDIRRRASEGRRALIARALGFKGGEYRIVDLTAGLGRDLATCAWLGMTVDAWERHPLMYALLDDAWKRCTPELQQRIRLHRGGATSTQWQAADAVLYDPMYPASKRDGAAPGLEMQHLRALLGSDDDVEFQFAALRARPPRRLAIKRPPRGVRVQLAAPDFSQRGGRVHWDVYLGH